MEIETVTAQGRSETREQNKEIKRKVYDCARKEKKNDTKGENK